MHGVEINDLFELRSDGAAVLRFGGRTYTLRRPCIREWRELLEMAESADQQLTLAERPTQILFASPPAYAAIMARAIELLAGVAMDPDELPTWCAYGEVIR